MRNNQKKITRLEFRRVRLALRRQAMFMNWGGSPGDYAALNRAMAVAAKRVGVEPTGKLLRSAASVEGWY